MKKITIISTGEELLNGSTVDANSAFISRGLADLDFQILSHITCGDSPDSIKSAIVSACNEADIVIMSGGLGPTDDDNTIDSLCSMFGLSASVDQGSLDRMKAFFTGMGRNVTEHDMKMVEVIQGAAVMENTVGLAPGFILKTGGKHIIAMPGVPSEMEAMFLHEVRPFLIREFAPETRQTVKVSLVGMKESDINQGINQSPVLSQAIPWGITASSGIATVSFFLDKASPVERDGIVREMRHIFASSMLPPGYLVPEQELLDELIKQGKTIAAGESCTGGLIAKRLTDVPGASQAFLGGLVAYSNEVKINRLGVPREAIQSHGAVSEEVAAAMARGVQNYFSADIAIATTGIAGPGGGSEHKPVGMVCFGFALGSELSVKTMVFNGDRQKIRTYASLFALDRVRKSLLNGNTG
ncbi:MAG TPA: CinA family nicotinamide mononucleotide deamidase-related protein [Spirochaetota bacterium]|nr:CinA family nicotinamide mononucleotide deamidase-related protein [Spirochaetota bacterium]HPI89187.1 CinA family nicotinamide mononucleotide deamidase-related protein [Spirochaetota bacterium]HPR46818.1 CinA family nicotinamide mononucleotide deamidase-related protein [Spirochaetota bacterium]